MVSPLLDGDDRRFAKHYPLAFYINERARGAKVDAHVVGEHAGDVIKSPSQDIEYFHFDRSSTCFNRIPNPP